MKSLLANQSLNQQGEVAVGLENRSITGEGIEQREDIESGRGIRAVKDRKIATQRLRERQEQIEEELKLEKEGSDRYLELMEETNGIQREIIDQRVEDLKRAGRAAISFASDIFAHQQEQTEIQITAQKERVKDAEKLAEEGKTKQLQIEEERLQELQDKRENFVQAQRALAAIEIAIQQGRAAALSIAAISEAVAQPFPTNLLAVPLVLGLIAQIGSGALAVSSAFSAVPEFHEGTERTGRGDVDGKGGFLSVLHPNERVVPEKDNARIGYDFPNEKIPEAVALYKAYPRMAGSAMTVGGTNDFGDVTAELKELRTDIQAMKFFMNITEDGIEAVVQKRVDGINRIEKIRG
jgi:DNA-binding HxlR family transcriptional regulator